MVTEPPVHVIDDDDAARDALVFLLTAAGYAVKAYDSATAFLDSSPGAQSGCVITDVRMPDISGLDLLKRLKSRKIDLPVIVITGHAEVATAIEAIRDGAVDFIEKPYDGEVLIESVRSALSGSEEDILNGQKSVIQERLNSLSSIERQVLEGLIEGRPNKGIAYDLQINARTIDIHRAGVMTKMQASSLSHLVRMGLLASK